MHIDQFVQVIPINIEQPVEQHNPHKNVGATLRWSTRKWKSTIPSDFVVYLQESDIRVETDPESFSEAMNSEESELWYSAMKEEINSMKSNKVWDLVDLPNGLKPLDVNESLRLKRTYQAI